MVHRMVVLGVLPFLALAALNLRQCKIISIWVKFHISLSIFFGSLGNHYWGGKKFPNIRIYLAILDSRGGTVQVITIFFYQIAFVQCPLIQNWQGYWSVQQDTTFHDVNGDETNLFHVDKCDKTRQIFSQSWLKWGLEERKEIWLML